MAIALLWVVVPLYLASVLSIKPRTQFFRGGLFPFLDFAPTLEHWRIEFAFFWYGPGMGPALVNSIAVGVLAALLAVVLGGLAAYALARRPAGAAGLVLPLLLLPRLIPPVIVALPYTQIMQGFGLYDSRLSLLLAHSTLLMPWALLILYGAIRTLPAELFEAAELEGCSDLLIVRTIVLPLCAGVLFATALLCFALSWNEYPFAVLNAGDHITTVPVAVAFLFTKDGIEFEYVGSHLLMALLPPMLLALAARRVVTQALSLGVVGEADGA